MEATNVYTMTFTPSLNL